MMRNQLSRIGAVIIAMNVLIASPSWATEVEDIVDACPAAWEGFYNNFNYQSGMQAWSDGQSDKAEFVRYASAAIFVREPSLGIDGSSELRTLSDLVEIARHCGAHHENYYQQLRQEALTLQSVISASSQNDSDNDGVNDAIDLCPGTVVGQSTSIQGCAGTQSIGGEYNDTDGDGLLDYYDPYPLQSNTFCPAN